MKDFRPNNIPKPFRQIFSRPFPFIECENAPEFAEKWGFADQGPYVRHISVRRLGLSPGEFIYDAGFDHLPEMVLYRLKDVPMFHSLSFSKSGGVFPPSLRYRQDGDITGFSLPRAVNPRPLGGGYFYYLIRPASSKVRVVEEAAMPFYTYNEYGHYLMESLPSLFFLKVKPDLKLIIQPPDGKIPSWLLAMVEPFGMNESSFILPDELTVFKNFYLPTRLYMESRYINSPAKEIYGRIAEYYEKPKAAGHGAGSRVYLSRRGVSNRSLTNEQECENAFKARGFTIVRPEELSFAAQVRLLSEAEYVAGPAGTAIHNVVFSRRGADLKVLMMMPENFLMSKVFYSIEAYYQRRPNCVFGRYADPATAEDHRLTFYSPWHLPLKELEAALDQWLG